MELLDKVNLVPLITVLWQLLHLPSVHSCCARDGEMDIAQQKGIHSCRGDLVSDCDHSLATVRLFKGPETIFAILYVSFISYI